LFHFINSDIILYLYVMKFIMIKDEVNELIKITKKLLI
jgi:hypothetical protein